MFDNAYCCQAVWSHTTMINKGAGSDYTDNLTKEA